MARPRRFLTLCLVVACGVSACYKREKFSEVVFVCEHGSVKSVIASEWFNRTAAERKIPVRSVSRGIFPDETIPQKIYENLKADGFDLTGFKPKRFDAETLSNEVMIVAIGVDIQNLKDSKNLQLLNWSDIPPASTNYPASRDVIRDHIQTLLEQLKQ